MNEGFLLKLFEHNNWANEKIMQTCFTLTDEQLDAQPQSATKDNIRGTLVHLVSSQRGYLALLTLPAEERPRTPVSFNELQDSLSSSGNGLVTLVRDRLNTLPDRLQTKDEYFVDPGVVLIQVINHATEHREQIKSMLSSLGITPPEIDGWDYGFATNTLVPISQ
jgi:uncharacterized damage-inducible protein DinB